MWIMLDNVRLNNFSFLKIQASHTEFVFRNSYQKEMVQKYFQYPGSETRPPLEELLKNISLRLVHSDSILFHPRPYPPNVIEVSGMHISQNETLPKDLQLVMNKAKNGAIFFSLGSYVDLSQLQKEVTDVFIKAFSKMKQTVLWKSETILPGLPKNIVMRKWFPQTAILSHPNCVLFITHGGLHSLIESVHFGVPILGFPLFADQETNIDSAVRKGFGIKANLYTITEENLVEYINRLNSKSYKEAARRMAELYHDKPMSPMDTAVYWVEYVIRHKGANHLKPASVELKWYQLHLLDVMLFVLVLIFMLLLSLYFSFKMIVFWLIKKSKSMLEKKKQ